MKKMNETELKVVLLVTRKTLGWYEKNGHRKDRDWISQKLFMEKTGKSNRAISTAIHSCLQQGWIEAYDKNGKELNTPEQRSGNRIYYRLGDMFRKKISNEESSQDNKPVKLTTQTSEVNDTKPVKKVHTTKETITKETIQNPLAPQSGADINAMIKLFENVNPNYERLYPNKSQRAALERMAAKFGEEKLGSVIKALPQIIVLPYAPKVTTPVDLERDMGKLMAFYQQEKGRTKNSKFVFL